MKCPLISSRAALDDVRLSQEPTLTRTHFRSASGQQRKSLILFDHLVSAAEQRRGTVRQSAVAVLRFRAPSKTTGCSTGSSSESGSREYSIDVNRAELHLCPILRPNGPAPTFQVPNLEQNLLAYAVREPTSELAGSPWHFYI
jgi:hypothetical protein